ncbi:retrovirus-related Pol polyprotein from transposon TNT 1-94 [Trichonephila clavipes]|nr:retrovirus-related Pol polyprotein from transposon TNT 1-94 [Trichonephila clavipes]
MSGPALDKNGGTFVGGKGKIEIFNRNGRKLFYARKINGLYYFKSKYPKNIYIEKSNLTTSEEKDLELWHNRFCHINSKHILRSSHNQSIRGIPKLKSINVECEDCKIGKSKRKSFKPISKIRSKKPLELLHMDVCSIPTASHDSSNCFLSITDDYSRKVTVFPIKRKSDVFNCFTRYQKWAERFLNNKVVNVRLDNGLEFIHKEFCTFLDSQGIEMERTNTYSPEMNCVSERFNYTALDALRAML